ncbi:MAG: xanthine dehydrogenase family protein molybdopterin-binding subunit [Acidobacteriaceae bacterium]|nr:xanthine dehydrogenase family protein molybdopterin-binding subunit [Acidobacteriaceae bacterium]MBV9443475.1 xanthine dehydrogenase family protein molybdopterin-binding subunit [Acidobacteriaceae bacterium]
MSARVQLASRRDFLRGVFSAGALILGARFIPAEMAEMQSGSGVENATWNPNVWVGVNRDGSVLIIAHRSEMGTGIRTSLPMVLADEMEADWSRVRVEQAIGSEKYGSQDTDGSCSIRDFYDTMREAGATVRALLVNAAASHWQVPLDECVAQNHEVIHKQSGRKLGYGELAVPASKQPLPHNSTIQLKKPAEFRYIGKGVPSVDLQDICTGRAMYGFDVQVPGMVYASIERAPVLGGTLRSFDDSQAKSVRGVQQTVVIEQAKPPYRFQALGGVAVIANNTWAAAQGRKKLKVEWESGPNAIAQTQSYKGDLITTVSKPQKVVRKSGDVDSGFQGAPKIVEATYYTPLLAHASMEPPAAVAVYREGKVEAWAATQSPQDVQKTVAEALSIKPTDVTCHVTLLGGAFGRKSKPDYVAEAAILSKKIGKPVKIAWTREEDLHFDFYHSTSAMYFKAALDNAGKPAAWLQRCAFPPISSTFDGKSVYGDDGELAMGWIDVPFDIPNFQAENGPAKPHVRIGWLRSVANIYHAFGVQCFIDELANAAGRDPFEYWLACLGTDRKLDFKGQVQKFTNYGKAVSQYPFDTARLRRVAETVADRSGWVNKKANKRAVGFAAHHSFLTYVATVAEIDVTSDGKVRIPRIDVAVDCGPVINPDRVKAQLEGAAVFGASIALMGEITLADGRVQQGNFNRYPVARMDDAPIETHVHLVPTEDAPPTGAGEPGVPPTSPAIYNAVFAATGRRLRELPLKNHKLV